MEEHKYATIIFRRQKPEDSISIRIKVEVMHLQTYLIVAPVIFSLGLAQSIQPITDDNKAPYIGCYTDEADGQRVLRGQFYGSNGNNDADSCEELCAGYAYFGLEFSLSIR